MLAAEQQTCREDEQFHSTPAPDSSTHNSLTTIADIITRKNKVN